MQNPDDAKSIAFALNPRATQVGQSEYKTSCPVSANHKHNDKNPSLTIGNRDGKLVWHCHGGCNQSDVMYALIDRGLLSPAGTPSAPTKPAVQTPAEVNEAALQYLYRRELSDETIAHFKIGSSNNAVVFPYYLDGELQHTKTKFLQEREGGQYLQSKGGGKCYYNLDSIDFTRPVIIVEGEGDAHASHESGHGNVISVPNGAALAGDDPFKREFIASTLERFDPTPTIIIATDGDAAGISLREKLADVYGRDRCSYIDTYPDGCKDLSDVLIKYSSDEVDLLISSATAYPVKGLQSADEHRDAVLQLYREGRSRGVSTGYENIDKFYTIQTGELEIVTGIPGSGKSNWIDQLIINTSKSELFKHAVCSFENPPDQHLASLSEKFAGASFVGHEGVKITEDQLHEAVDFIDKHVTFIRLSDDTPPTVDAILRHARAAVLRFGIKTLTIDPWNYVLQSRQGQTETEYVSETLSKLRNFAQRHGVHVWLVAHPSKMLRSADGSVPAPTGMDILGSVHFFTKADVLTCIHRNPTVSPADVEVHFRKVRFKTTGSPASCDLRYSMATGCYQVPADV